MLAYILMVLLWILALSGFGIVFYHRKLPVIACRDLLLTSITIFYVVFDASLNMITFELYYSDFEAFQEICPYTISWVIALSTTFVTPILCRVYNVQFKYYTHSEMEKKGMAMETSFHAKYRYTATYKAYFVFSAMICALTVIPVAIANGMHPLPSNPSNFTECFGYFIYVMIAQGILDMIILTYLVYKCWRLSDPYDIKNEFKIWMLLGYPTFFLWFVLQLIDTITYSTLFPASFQPMFLQPLSSVATVLGGFWYPAYLIYREKKRDLGIAPDFEGNSIGSNISLQTILTNEYFLKEFRAIAVQYWCVEAVLFHADAIKYEHVEDPQEREAYAKVMARNYLDQLSPLCINIPGAMAKTIEETMSQGEYPKSLFHAACLDVTAQLEGVLLRWKTTPEFKRMIARSGTRSFERQSHTSTNYDMESM